MQRSTYLSKTKQIAFQQPRLSFQLLNGKDAQFDISKPPSVQQLDALLNESLETSVVQRYSIESLAAYLNAALQQQVSDALAFKIAISVLFSLSSEMCHQFVLLSDVSRYALLFSCEEAYELTFVLQNSQLVDNNAVFNALVGSEMRPKVFEFLLQTFCHFTREQQLALAQRALRIRNGMQYEVYADFIYTLLALQLQRALMENMQFDNVLAASSSSIEKLSKIIVEACRNQIVMPKSVDLVLFKLEDSMNDGNRYLFDITFGCCVAIVQSRQYQHLKHRLIDVLEKYGDMNEYYGERLKQLAQVVAQ